MKNITRLIFPFLLVVLSFNLVTTPLLAGNLKSNIRGVLSEERYPSDLPRSLLSSVLYLPRQAYNATLYGVGKVGKTIGDPDFIDKVEDILYLYKKDLLWYPIVDYGSGFRPSYGAGLYYSNGYIKSRVKFETHDSDYYDYLARVSYKKSIGSYFAKVYALGRVEQRDDIRFHGIGGDPENDSRNRFIRLTDQDYGVLTQARKKMEWGVSGYDARKTNTLKYMGYYERKSFQNSGVGNNDLEDVFDLSEIPGFSEGPVSQVYNEVSYVFDSRQYKKRLSSGIRVGGYYGLSAGVQDNPSDLWKTGADIIAFVPIYKDNRLLIPRVTMDYVDNLNGAEIPFTEYAQHPTFRGVSTREWVRNDQASVVPSVEYKWPVSNHLSAHLFFDYLTVGENFRKLDWDDGLWALGGGVDFTRDRSEWARLQFAGGTEGFYFKFTVGKPFQKNTRSG